jgi:hypothetical protein
VVVLDAAYEDPGFSLGRVVETFENMVDAIAFDLEYKRSSKNPPRLRVAKVLWRMKPGDSVKPQDLAPED